MTEREAIRQAPRLIWAGDLDAAARLLCQLVDRDESAGEWLEAIADLLLDARETLSSEASKARSDSWRGPGRRR